MREKFFRAKKIRKAPFFLAKHCFWFFIVLLVIAAAGGLFLFYKYNIVPDIMEMENSEKLLEFDQESYDKVLQGKAEREQMILESETKIRDLIFAPVD